MARSSKKNTIQNKDIPKIVSSISLFFLVTLYPILYIYLKNAEMLQFVELAETFGLFFLAAVILYFICFLCLRSYQKAALVVSFSMLAFLNFALVERVFVKISPFFYYWHVLYILISVIVLAVLIIRKWTDEITEKINKIILVLVTFLIVFNVVSAMPKLVQSRKAVVIEDIQIISQKTTDVRRNVYIFVFDEFSGPEALQRYNQFDNGSFYDSLEALGFNTSRYSHNGTFSTNIEIPNLINMSQILTNENYTTAYRNELLKKASLFEFFKSYGYNVHVISDQEFIPSDVENVDEIFVPSTGLSKFETFKGLIINNSVFYPFLQNYRGDRVVEINQLFEKMEDSKSAPNGSQFTFGYFMVPHLPWVVDENGKRIDGNLRTDWKNPSVYLGQLKYTSTRILRAVTKIIDTDPNSTIILLSDHAYRLPHHLSLWYGEEIEDPDLEMYYQTNILNAVYIGGNELDIEGLNGVETINKVLNLLFNTDVNEADN